MERIGVSAVETAFTTLGWAFREQHVADQGIDAIVEVDGQTTEPTGRYFAVQIKCGSVRRLAPRGVPLGRPTGAGIRPEPAQ
jgi:hypothetical protein